MYVLCTNIYRHTHYIVAKNQNASLLDCLMHKANHGLMDINVNYMDFNISSALFMPSLKAAYTHTYIHTTILSFCLNGLSFWSYSRWDQVPSQNRTFGDNWCRLYRPDTLADPKRQCQAMKRTRSTHADRLRKWRNSALPNTGTITINANHKIYIYITTTISATNDDQVLKTGATNVFQQQEANSVTNAAPLEQTSYSAIRLHIPANVVKTTGLRYTTKRQTLHNINSRSVCHSLWNSSPMLEIHSCTLIYTKHCQSKSEI